MKKVSIILIAVAVMSLMRFAASPSVDSIRNVDAILLFVSGFAFGGSFFGLIGSRRTPRLDQG